MPYQQGRSFSKWLLLAPVLLLVGSFIVWRYALPAPPVPFSAPPVVPVPSAAPTPPVAPAAPAPPALLDAPVPSAAPAAPAPTVPAKIPVIDGPRVLWTIDTPDHRDRFTHLVPAGDKLLGVRRGVVYALDARTGEVIWRVPAQGHGRTPRNISSDFILGVRDGRVVTRFMPHLRGIQELRLSDGALLRAVDLKPEIGFPSDDFVLGHVLPDMLGRHAVFIAGGRKEWKSEVCFFDLEEWREVKRFRIPRSWAHSVSGTSLYGMFRNKEHTDTPVVFSVNVATGEAFKMPMRSRYTLEHATVLPTGTRLFPEGSLDSKCAYTGHLARTAYARIRYIDGAAYVFDRFGVSKVDLANGKREWSLHLPPTTQRHYIKAAGGDGILLARIESGIHVINANTGKLRAAVRVIPVERTAGERRSGFWSSQLAYSSGVGFFSWDNQLVAFRTDAVGRDRPDAADPADPAYSISMVRRAAAQGDIKGALAALHYSSSSVMLRPECQAEYSSLFSQISRSHATVKLPELWTEVLLDDGWVCGELFLESYVEMLGDRNLGGRAAAALYAIGSQGALAVLERRVEAHGDAPGATHIKPNAVKLRWELTRERVATGPERKGFYGSVDDLLEPPLSEDEFKSLLPKLRGRSGLWIAKYIEHISAEWSVELLEGLSDRRLAGKQSIVRKQLESRRKGEGIRFEVETVKGPEPDPVDAQDDQGEVF